MGWCWLGWPGRFVFSSIFGETVNAQVVSERSCIRSGPKISQLPSVSRVSYGKMRWRVDKSGCRKGHSMCPACGVGGGVPLLKVQLAHSLQSHAQRRSKIRNFDSCAQASLVGQMARARRLIDRCENVPRARASGLAFLATCRLVQGLP